MAISGWWQKHSGRKRCKLEAKGAHISTQAVHFSHQCLLLFPASCQRHWCRHYPPLYSNYTASQCLIKRSNLQTLCSTSPNKFQCFKPLLCVSDGRVPNRYVMDGSQWSAGKHPFAFYSVSGWRCNCTSECIIQEESMAWMDIASTWVKLQSSAGWCQACFSVCDSQVHCFFTSSTIMTPKSLLMLLQQGNSYWKHWSNFRDSPIGIRRWKHGNNDAVCIQV